LGFFYCPPDCGGLETAENAEKKIRIQFGFYSAFSAVSAVKKLLRI
jgi:hypothetical protein